MNPAVLEVFALFFRLGLLAWGGGQVVLAEMEREAVGHGWLSHAQFLEAYAIGQMTPGPGTLYVVPIGYQAAGITGALAAVLGFFLPTGIIAFAAIQFWSRLRQSPWPAAARAALGPVVIGLVLASVYTIGRGALTDVRSVAVAGGSVLLFWRSPLPTPLVILAAGALGAVIGAH
jgi:chromate transporter